MIDVESQIYTPIAEALRAQFPGILVSGEYVNAPTRFPYVSLVEQDNYTTEALQTLLVTLEDFVRNGDRVTGLERRNIRLGPHLLVNEPD